MQDDQLAGHGVDVVLHLTGDTPLVATIGGRRVLLVPPSVTGSSLSHVMGGLSVTDEGVLAATGDVDDRVIYGAGDIATVRGEDEDEDDDVHYGPGVVPARVEDPAVIGVDVDKLLEMVHGPLVTGHPNRQLRVAHVAHVVLPPESAG